MNSQTAVRCAGIGLLAATIAFFAGCTISHTTPNSPVVYHLPAPVDTIISQSQISTLVKLGMTVNDGTSPPSIDGNYFCDTLVLLGSNVSGDFTNGKLDFHSYVNYSYQFSNQTSDGEISVARAVQNGTSTGFGTGAIISGSGNDFSIFVEITDSMYSDSDSHLILFKSARIISGTLAAGGIEAFRYAFICTGKENDYYNEEIDVGEGRVIYEEDNLASAVSMYPYTPAAKMLARMAKPLGNDARKHKSL